MKLKTPKTTKQMGNTEQEKSQMFIVLGIVEYVPNSVVIKTIISKTTGNVTVSSVDTGEDLTRKISPFDNLIQVIDGKAEVVLDDQSHLLQTGQAIIIPAHTSNVIRSNVRLKMVSTVFVGGYGVVRGWGGGVGG
jgi:quercetin dioxygenase-like cupin family protein